MQVLLAIGVRTGLRTVAFSLAVTAALLVGSASSAVAQSESAAPVLTSVSGLNWYTDYYTAQTAAKNQRKMLLINFLPAAGGSYASMQQSLETWIAADPSLQDQLEQMILARLPDRFAVDGNGQGTPLVRHAAFREMSGQPGIAILDYRNVGQEFYRHVVTALPYGSGKYYRWQNDHLNVAVSLPPGTISQRTMVWAVRTHPEMPASTVGYQHPALADAAADQSQYQAQIGVQGHHRWDSRFHQIRSAVGAGEASEVVAESWPGQNLIDSCIDCVQSWRHSPGHWGAVRGRHRLFGYDIRRGGNGIWYGTGIFAN